MSKTTDTATTRWEVWRLYKHFPGNPDLLGVVRAESRFDAESIAVSRWPCKGSCETLEVRREPETERNKTE